MTSKPSKQGGSAPAPRVTSTRKNTQRSPRKPSLAVARRAKTQPLPKRRIARSKFNWAEIRAAYLTPTVAEDGATASWPTMVDLARTFECSLTTIKERSAQEGWVAQQCEAMDRWWSDRNLELNRQMARSAATVRMAAFTGGARAIKVANEKLAGAPDAGTMLKAASTLVQGLRASMNAAGVATPGEGVNLGVNLGMGFFQAPGANGAQGDAPEPAAPVPPTSLWGILVNAHRNPPPPLLEGQALPPDPYDHPSPLPPSQASDRR